MRHEMTRFFTRYDVLFCPTSPLPAFPHESLELEIEGHKLDARHAMRATMPFDLTGSPTISVPFGWSPEGLPIGVQLAGRHFDEATILRVAQKLEESGEGRGRQPPV